MRVVMCWRYFIGIVKEWFYFFELWCGYFKDIEG